MPATEEKEFCIQVRVTSSAYKTIKAKSLKDAKRIARKQAKGGHLKDDLGIDIWEDIREVNIAEDFINGNPKGEWASVETSEIL